MNAEEIAEYLWNLILDLPEPALSVVEEIIVMLSAELES